jgi:O-antigen ligase
MFSLDEPSNAIRVDLATETLKCIKEHPIIGQGFGSWGRVVPPRTVKEGGCQGGSSFNIFLGFMYDGGILALIALVLVWYFYLKSCRDLLRITKDPYHKTILFIAVLVFVDIMVTAQFHPTWMAGYAWLAIAMGMAIINIVKREVTNENSISTA